MWRCIEIEKVEGGGAGEREELFDVLSPLYNHSIYSFMIIPQMLTSVKMVAMIATGSSPGVATQSAPTSAPAPMASSEMVAPAHVS